MLPRNTACTPDGRPAIHRRAALHHSGQRRRFELIHDPGLDAHKACVSITQRCPDTNLEYPRHFFRRLFSAAEPSPFNKSAYDFALLIDVVLRFQTLYQAVQGWLIDIGGLVNCKLHLLDGIVVVSLGN